MSCWREEVNYYLMLACWREELNFYLLLTYWREEVNYYTYSADTGERRSIIIFC
jgi:hypothetical protein